MGHKKLVSADVSTDYPSFLKKAWDKQGKTAPESHPQLFNLAEKRDQKYLQALISSNSVSNIVDNYGEQYAELLLSRNAHLYQANYLVQVESVKDLLKEHYGKKKQWELGTWAYFPWSRELVHVLGQEDFENLRTIRNRDLITSSEQAKLFGFEAACFGMSVGSAGALALGITGISRKMKLIDGAVISGSNLNRIMTGVSSVGVPKSEVIGRQIYEMNPYSTIEYHEKVDDITIEKIFDGSWPLKVVIDEIDDIEMKVRLRMEAKKRKIPVVMATELGDTVMLDVERFDLEPNRQIFHDMIPGIENLVGTKLENRREWMKHAVNIIGPENMPVRMQESLLKIGSTIVTHPQLGSTVMMTGGVLAFAVKNIALGNSLDSGRYVVSLENKMLSDHKTRKHKKHHKQHTKIIKRAVSSM